MYLVIIDKYFQNCFRPHLPFPREDAQGKVLMWQFAASLRHSSSSALWGMLYLRGFGLHELFWHGPKKSIITLVAAGSEYHK